MPKLIDVLKAETGTEDVAALALARVQALEPNLLKSQARVFTEGIRARYITTHGPTKEMLASASMLARHDDPVLIVGPTGTGKELVAEILHAGRGCHGAPLVAFNCAGLPNELFESLLYGHTKGSFTGAVADEPGLLRSANKGTVMFDEVGELPLNQQAKLLRVLQTRKVRPIGSAQEYALECRFIFATLRDIPAMVRAGTFRADLFFRIARFVLPTYSLAERPGDIAPIIEHICKMEGYDYSDFCESDGTLTHIPPEVYATGNVRALENYVARRAKLMLSHEQAIEHLSY